jgi:predicted RNA polymerase sigma factor
VATDTPNSIKGSINGAIDAVWRIESPRLIAGLARIVRDIGIAEDLAQDALVAALEQWPKSGVPDNPGAWLMAAAKHRAIDYFRRNTTLASSSTGTRRSTTRA